MKHKFDLINLVAQASPVHKARYSTNWDRKGLPGSEIQMYYDYLCHMYIYMLRKPAKRLDRLGWNLLWTLMGGWGVL